MRNPGGYPAPGRSPAATRTWTISHRWYSEILSKRGRPLRTRASRDVSPRRPHAHGELRVTAPGTRELPHRRSPGKLRAAHSRARHLRTSLRHALPARTRLRPLPDAAHRPRPRSRLAGIIANLTERIAEARANGWLGESHGLQVSLHAAQAKLAALDRMRNRTPATITDLGIPRIPHPSPDRGPR
jgi:hypothetical protein